MKSFAILLLVTAVAAAVTNPKSPMTPKNGISPWYANFWEEEFVEGEDIKTFRRRSGVDSGANPVSAKKKKTTSKGTTKKNDENGK